MLVSVSKILLPAMLGFAFAFCWISLLWVFLLMYSSLTNGNLYFIFENKYIICHDSLFSEFDLIAIFQIILESTCMQTKNIISLLFCFLVLFWIAYILLYLSGFSFFQFKVFQNWYIESVLTACFSPLNVCSISYLTTIFLPSFLPVVSAELQQPQEAGRPTLFSQGALAAIQPVWYKRFVDMNQSWEILVAKGHFRRIFGTGVEESAFPNLLWKVGSAVKRDFREIIFNLEVKKESHCAWVGIRARITSVFLSLSLQD